MVVLCTVVSHAQYSTVMEVLAGRRLHAFGAAVGETVDSSITRLLREPAHWAARWDIRRHEGGGSARCNTWWRFTVTRLHQGNPHVRSAAVCFEDNSSATTATLNTSHYTVALADNTGRNTTLIARTTQRFEPIPPHSADCTEEWWYREARGRSLSDVATHVGYALYGTARNGVVLAVHPLMGGSGARFEGAAMVAVSAQAVQTAVSSLAVRTVDSELRSALSVHIVDDTTGILLASTATESFASETHLGGQTGTVTPFNATSEHHTENSLSQDGEYVVHLAVPFGGRSVDGFVTLPSRSVREEASEAARWSAVWGVVGLVVSAVCCVVATAVAVRPLRHLSLFLQNYAVSGAVQCEGAAKQNRVTDAFSRVLKWNIGGGYFGAELCSLYDTTGVIIHSLGYYLDRVQETLLAELLHAQTPNPLGISNDVDLDDSPPDIAFARRSSLLSEPNACGSGFRFKIVVALSLRFDAISLVDSLEGASTLVNADTHSLECISRLCKLCRLHTGLVHAMDESGLTVLFLNNDSKVRAVRCVAEIASLRAAEEHKPRSFIGKCVLGARYGNVRMWCLGTDTLRYCAAAGGLIREARLVRELCHTHGSHTLVCDRLAQAVMKQESELEELRAYFRPIDRVAFLRRDTAVFLVDVCPTFEDVSTADIVSVWRSYVSFWDELDTGSDLEVALEEVGSDVRAQYRPLLRMIERLKDVEGIELVKFKTKLGATPYVFKDCPHAGGGGYSSPRVVFSSGGEDTTAYYRDNTSSLFSPSSAT